MNIQLQLVLKVVSIFLTLAGMAVSSLILHKMIKFHTPEKGLKLLLVITTFFLFGTKLLEYCLFPEDGSWIIPVSLLLLTLLVLWWYGFLNPHFKKTKSEEQGSRKITID